MTLKHFALGCLAMSLSSVVSANYLTDFGDPNTAKLKQALQSGSVHVVQLGDSHTAADLMTDATRTTLQNALGDGGMGWAMPMYFSGQRMAQFGYDNVNFNPVSSRSNQSENYTLGGLLAKPNYGTASLTLKDKQNHPEQKLLVSVRQSPSDGKFTGFDAYGRAVSIEAPKKDNTWQMVSIQAKLPLTIYSEQASGSAIGGWWGFNTQGSGAVVSALGINGAELAHWNRWNDTAISNELSAVRPQVVVLAYGTNEGYGNSVSSDAITSELTRRIHQIRRASPDTAVVIMGAPEALRSTSGSCGVRPAALSDVQYAQRQVAQTQKTLYWDWQAAMGGSCSMKPWINAGLASRDGVHFSKSGYTRLGEQFGYDLLSLRHR